MKALATFMATAAAVGVIGTASTPAQAATTCTFTIVGTTWNLDADCTTDATIVVPDGVTLNGNGNTITAEDPLAGHFVGGVVENGGAVAHVSRLTVNTSSLVNVCDVGDDRLRGIMFDGASGSITHNTVEDINQGASGCQEGNAIEVRNGPFDGMHPATETVEIAHNVLQNWQKTGIVCNGDVDCNIHHNKVGESFTQNNLAANSIQVGFGGIGLVEHNNISGNQWFGCVGIFAGSAVLLFEADSPTVRRNNIGGNADVGILIASDDVAIDNNRVFEMGVDGGCFDVGIWDFGDPGSSITNNKVRGYDSPADDNGSGNITGTKVVPAPHDPGAACFLPDTSAQAC